MIRTPKLSQLGGGAESGREVGRLLIATGCLPVKIDFKKRSLTLAEGGVNGALRTLERVVLVGYVDAEPSHRPWITKALAAYHWHPVFLDKADGDAYFEDFSNNILYSTFHYMQIDMSRVEHMQSAFGSYKRANAAVADTVVKIWRPGDLVWVHDYPLLMVPSLLRRARPKMRIGFFLHIPFPSSELYRALPMRCELLEGVLGADLIGFQVHDYARHFESACVRLLGAHTKSQRLVHGDRECTIITCPIGMDRMRFRDALGTREVKELVAQLERDYRGRKIMLGFDRFDNIKGIPHKFYAIERFLKDNPEWIGKVVLLQIASDWDKKAPDSEEYQRLSQRTNDLVGRINGRFGTLSAMPIHYLTQSISLHELCALYQVADVMVVSSTRDGMNLVAHEYVACQKHKHGVLVLSEFTGAARSLGAGSLQVNPWNVQAFARTIRRALTMSDDERAKLHSFAYRYVREHSLSTWSKTFVGTLRSLVREEKAARAASRPLDSKSVKASFRLACNRIVISGLGGTLFPYTTPQRELGAAVPVRRTPSYQSMYKEVSPEVKAAIRRIAADPNTTLIVISNATREEMIKRFGDTDAWLAAENGIFLKAGRADSRWHRMTDYQIDTSWKECVNEVFRYFSERTPNTFVQEHETTCSWHYHDAERGFADKQANDMMIHLRAGTLSNLPVEVQDTRSVIQIRPSGLSKGNSLVKILQHYEKWRESDGLEDEEEGQRSADDSAKGPIDFVLCVGNLTKLDEDLFSVVDGIQGKGGAGLLNVPSMSSLSSAQPQLTERAALRKCMSVPSALHTGARSAPTSPDRDPDPAKNAAQDAKRRSPPAAAKATQTPGTSPDRSGQSLGSPESADKLSPPTRGQRARSLGDTTLTLPSSDSISAAMSDLPRAVDDLSVFTVAVGRSGSQNAEFFVQDHKEACRLLVDLSAACKTSQQPKQAASASFERHIWDLSGGDLTGGTPFYNGHEMSADSGFWYFS